MMEVVPGPARDALARLQAMEVARLEENADRLLSFDYPEVDPAQAPFLAAALQVDWLARVNACGANAFKKLEMAGLCPACGSPPVSSVIRIDVPVPGTRYLACALCGTSWRMGRGQCTQCDTQEKLAYYHLEGGDEVVKAVALDVLMDDSDFARASPNLFFVPGQG